MVVGEAKPFTICPHPGGGRNWNASSYNPETKVLYTPMVESCMDLIPAGPGERGFGHAQLIQVTADDMLRGAADPRPRDGACVGL